jgi:hypothetical protein
VYLADRRICLALDAIGVATLKIEPDVRAILPALAEWAVALGYALVTADTQEVSIQVDRRLQRGLWP